MVWLKKGNKNRLRLLGNYTQIPNDVLEALCRVYLSTYECRMLMCIVRKTFGFQKRADRIAFSQFSKISGVSRPNCLRALRSLQLRAIVIREDENQSWRVNNDTDTWLPPIRPRVARKSRDRLSSSNDSAVVSRENSSSSNSDVISRNDSVLSVETTEVLLTETTKSLPLEIITKERKENKEKELNKSRPSAASVERDPETHSNRREKLHNKELSEQRNMMAKSRLYSDQELVDLKNRSVEELRQIHNERQLHQY
jgi:phage replication O-like protein O